MAINLNQDMGALMRDIMGKNNKSHSLADSAQASFSEKIAPFTNAIVIFTLIAGTTFAYYKMYYLKTVRINQEKTQEIARLNDLKTQTVELEKKISALKEQLNFTKEEYLKSISYFDDSEDLGELYQSISTLAEKYGLKVLIIKELPNESLPPPPLDLQETPIVTDKTLIGLKEVSVSVELKGPYTRYIKFKEDLAGTELLLRINEETVKVKQDYIGIIYAELNLTTYAIDKKSFVDAINNDKIDNKENKND